MHCIPHIVDERSIKQTSLSYILHVPCTYTYLHVQFAGREFLLLILQKYHKNKH